MLAAFYPGAIASSVLVLSEAPFCPLMLLQLVLWIIAWRRRGRRQAAIGFCGGLAAGAATLMRPSWLLFTPLARGGGVAGVAWLVVSIQWPGQVQGPFGTGTTTMPHLLLIFDLIPNPLSRPRWPSLAG